MNWSFLFGINGQPELIRTSGALGLVCFVFSVIGFQAWALCAGDHFDVVAFCAAFSGGLAVVYTSISASTALKDRQGATAKVISQTGAVPTAPPAGPPVPVEPKE